ncbi:BMP family ABC transporter substrate-binding protein [Amnibacterium sp. CER49]|uniref:BMP family lipoprotein n=1 Tax=Amnibacterium sp. CER49 TaxID=3039161 RepID=UPI002446A873|nr:BMP family ABC transporter substrate-binding protein [Amnibacterium sp. CER49]MDH2443112.1 BMP family ABC transporter substrate-binding protein [Amnibacterium sp. CER49]
MPVPLKRLGLGALAGVSVIALLTGCGQAPKSSSSGSTKAASSSKYLPCIVSDQGGFDDHSFNELGLTGVKQAAQKIGSSVKQVQSATANDYASNINNLIAQKCNIVVASGFNLVSAVKDAAAKSPKTDFAMIDDNSIKAPNVKPVVFETDEAAFLGGYAAAAYSKTGVVATYGGAQIPPVTIYMDGVADGIAYFNKQKHKNVRLLGWNEQTQKGTFVGDFKDQNKAKTYTTNFLNANADVVIPVGGPLYQGAGAAIKASGKKAVLEGVDADLFQTDTAGYKDLFLVSILKNIATAADSVVTQAASGKTFDNTVYVGTLKNDGVGLSSFHGYASTVPSSLQSELDAIKKGISDGSIPVSSPSSFNK